MRVAGRDWPPRCVPLSLCCPSSTFPSTPPSTHTPTLLPPTHTPPRSSTSTSRPSKPSSPTASGSSRRASPAAQASSTPRSTRATSSAPRRSSPCSSRTGSPATRSTASGCVALLPPRPSPSPAPAALTPRRDAQGWRIFRAFDAHCRLPGGGFAGVRDVDAKPGAVVHEDRMETFWIVRRLFLFFSHSSSLGEGSCRGRRRDDTPLTHVHHGAQTVRDAQVPVPPLQRQGPRPARPLRLQHRGAPVPCV